MILQDHLDGVALLADHAAELFDRGVIKLAERVKVGNLFVVVESGRGTLLESENPYVHRDHVSANKRVNVVKGASLIFLLFIGEDVIVIFASRRRCVRCAGGVSIGVTDPLVCRVLAIVDRGWLVGRFWSNFG